jgi:Peptidase M16C associated
MGHRSLLCARVWLEFRCASLCLHDFPATSNVDNSLQARFKQMVLETKAEMEAGVIGAGHSFASSRLSAQRTVSGWVNEQMAGLEHLFYVRELAKRVDSEWDAIKADMQALRACVLATVVRRRPCALAVLAIARGLAHGTCVCAIQHITCMSPKSVPDMQLPASLQ